MHHDSHREDVARGRHPCIRVELFRGSVPWSTVSRVASGCGESKVHDADDAIGVHENIVRLEIEMSKAEFVVYVGHAFRRLEQHGYHFIEATMAAPLIERECVIHDW